MFGLYYFILQISRRELDFKLESFLDFGFGFGLVIWYDFMLYYTIIVYYFVIVCRIICIF